MPRTGLLIGLAAILIAAAVGVLVWTNFLRVPGSGSLPAVTSSGTAPASTGESSKEQQWIQAMVETAGQNGFAATFSEADARKWALSGGHRLERFSVDGKGTVFARLSSENPISAETLLDGVYAELSPAFANYSKGHDVEIGVVARMANANAADKFSAIYLTRQAGNSGWRTFALTPEFQLYKFEFSVPDAEGGYTASPIVALYGDPAGGGKGVEILGIYVKAKP